MNSVQATVAMCESRGCMGGGVMACDGRAADPTGCHACHPWAEVSSFGLAAAHVGQPVLSRPP